MKSAAARPPSSTLQTLIDLTWKLNAPATQIPFDVNVALVIAPLRMGTGGEMGILWWPIRDISYISPAHPVCACTCTALTTEVWCKGTIQQHRLHIISMCNLLILHDTPTTHAQQWFHFHNIPLGFCTSLKGTERLTCTCTPVHDPLLPEGHTLY